MKPNSKNPSNPFAPAVNAIEEANLQFFLKCFQEHINGNGGNFNTLVSMTFIPGMAEVYRYISFEMLSNPVSDNLFDYFNVAPYSMTAPATDASDPVSMQQVVSNTSDDDTASEHSLYAGSTYILTSVSDWTYSVNNEDRPALHIIPSPSPAPILTLEFNPQPHAPVVINLDFAVHEENPGVYQHVSVPSELPYANWSTSYTDSINSHTANAQDIPLARPYHYDEIFSDAAMNQVVAVGEEDSGPSEEAPGSETSYYYLVSIHSGGSFF